MVDTRAEHLLLAAGRLGRKRAFVLGLLKQVEKEKVCNRDNRRKAPAADGEKEKEKKKDRGSQTPKRDGP